MKAIDAEMKEAISKIENEIRELKEKQKQE